MLEQVDPKSVEKQTEFPTVEVGIEEFACDLRPDLNGLRVKVPGQSAIYLIIDGRRHHIPNPTTYNNIFKGWDGIVQDVGVADICTGSTLSSGAVLAKGSSSGTVYLVTNGVKRGIPNPAVFNRYYFDWRKIVVVPQVLMDFIPAGPHIPAQT